MRIGIDPGSSGGIAVEWPDSSVNAYKMPDTDTEIIELFQSITSKCPSIPISCTMEQVGGYIGTHPVSKAMPCPHCRQTITYMEQQGQPASTMFVFGEGYGFLRACCLMAGFRFELVTPRVWQACVGMHKEKGEGKAEWKRRLKDRAQKLFPQIKVTLSTADALLILEYSRRVISNKIAPKQINPVKQELQTNLL